MITVVVGCVLLGVLGAQASSPAASKLLSSLQSSQPVPTPVELTAEQDHKLMLQQLHISSLRAGANPNAPNSANAPNYDEAKANPYPKLPDPLLLKNGNRVKTGRDWWKLRRPEIVEDFDREVYGRVPANVPGVNWEVISTTQEKNGDRNVVTRKIA